MDIQYLARNLRQLGQVIRDVTKQVPSLSADDHKWDLKALPQICGDFRKTLNDCERFLRDESKFSQGREGFIYNIQWNLIIEPEVARLKDRVAFHNIKVKSGDQFKLLWALIQVDLGHLEAFGTVRGFFSHLETPRSTPFIPRDSTSVNCDDSGQKDWEKKQSFSHVMISVRSAGYLIRPRPSSFTFIFHLF